MNKNEPKSAFAPATGYATELVAAAMMWWDENKPDCAAEVLIPVEAHGFNYPREDHYDSRAGSILVAEVCRLRAEVARLKSHNNEAERRAHEGEKHA